MVVWEITSVDNSEITGVASLISTSSISERLKPASFAPCFKAAITPVLFSRVPFTPVVGIIA